MKSCFYIGHRDTPSKILTSLRDAVEHHITEYDVKDFVVGHYGSFDELATKTVIDAKKRHPQVTLTLLLPYAFDRPESKPEGFDYVLYPDGLEKVPKRFAIIRANRYMIEHSSHLIAYVSHPSWGSRDILEAALRRQKRGLIKVTNLAGWYPHNMA